VLAQEDTAEGESAEAGGGEHGEILGRGEGRGGERGEEGRGERRGGERRGEEGRGGRGEEGRGQKREQQMSNWLSYSIYMM
jgi:hypothetical protein